ncbi:MAG: hypothetical protein K2Q33_03905, partial [Gammaproteobacteria bacterium]|nr:hypothetical protein [Gammaproteobacteria bacterium]
MSMSRNFLFYLLRDSEIKLNYTYKIKDNLYLIQIPTLLATPSVYYQNKKYKIQDAHLSIFRSYDKKEKIPQFSISHITLAFKINDYTESQIKVRVYLDLGGQPQEVGGKNCTVKLITEAKKDIYLDLGEEIETALVETAIFSSQEIIENIYNNYTTLIRNNQKLIDEILQELNHSELSQKRFRPLIELKAACIWSEKYRPSDSIRTYHISLKNLAAQELEAIQLKKARRKRNRVAEQPLSAAPLLPTPSSLSTEQVPITTELKWKKIDKTTETIKLGQKKLEEARKAMKTNLCFDTLYNFLKVISLQIEIEIPHSDNMEQIFSMTSEAKECRRKLERILSTAFYQYENGKNKSDEIKQFLQLPLPDLKKFIDEIDDLIFSQVVLVGLIKMRE